ncbi:HCL170Wp [Eremothecium sinecaudum]|uniref:Protein-lysine N-methyltransferase EFM4 n=1 Tax=Eremothecium sinecaudum TaxID=45286 RepID=A0A109UYM1_9SACH|nr:HCL170Wp [Eremothecium sinecaudum]AMD19981.1 HCL170Wp [Eremothecium sinecaudum]
MDDTLKLNKSKLGTKEYWDEFYSLEKKNFEENPEDTGECWFSENDVEHHLVKFMEEFVEDGEVDWDASMLDLGTGNGHLLFTLAEEGFKGRMVGVDYSEKSVEFANEILKKQHSTMENLSFYAADIFSRDWNPRPFDVVLDKGTLDAIALSGLTLENGQSILDAYHKVVEKVLKETGVFIITSCNYAEEELIKIVAKGELKVLKTIEYPKFEFGGVKGSAISTVAFVKK